MIIIIILQLLILILLVNASIKKDGYKVTIITLSIAAIISIIGVSIWEVWGWV